MALAVPAQGPATGAALAAEGMQVAKWRRFSRKNSPHKANRIIASSTYVVDFWPLRTSRFFLAF
jgi:hypothetical protein